MTPNRPWIHRFATVVAAAALACASGSASAGTIRGQVELSGARPSTGSSSANAYPGRANSMSGGAGAQNRGGAGETVIVLAKLPAGLAVVPPAATKRPALEQRQQAFVPRVLAVQAGTTVDFPNRDPVFHNVFSVSPAKRFDLGKYARGQSRSVRFDKPGHRQRLLRHPLGHGGLGLRRAPPRLHAAERGRELLPADAAAPAATRSRRGIPICGTRRVEVQVPARGDATVRVRY